MAHRGSLRPASVLLGGVGLALAALASGCGGGGGGGGGIGQGPRLVLVHFLQSGEDNVPLNDVLEFSFNANVDVSTVDTSSIQVRAGGQFGQTVEGRFVVQGSKVFFEPRLPGLCSLADSGFRADTDYRVTLIGSPEEFALKSTAGDPFEATSSFSFHTRSETDPNGLFDDQVPGVFPFVVSTSPADGAYPPLSPEVNIGPGNRVIVDFSENIDPCSISPTTVRLNQVATGDPEVYPNGFGGSDVTPGDPYSWGAADVPTVPYQRIRATYLLTQTFLSTRLEIIPDFGEFPDNALIVVDVTTDVRDFGGNPLIPKVFSFVTENRTEQCKAKLLAFNGDVLIDENLSTADVDTARAPSRAQGFLLFAGDGDNGSNPTKPSGPDCAPYSQSNDGAPDDLDTTSGDIVLDTGASPNLSCNNTTDGSSAVVFEFRTIRIRTTRTVSIVGANPAILLVAGDVLIEPGGSLLARGGNGVNGQGGYNYPSGYPAALGGSAVAGGAKGGTSNAAGVHGYSQNGAAGYGSVDYLQPAGKGGPDPIRVGAGRGNISVSTVGTSYSTAANVYAPGGGGGHAVAGITGAANGSGTSPKVHDGTPDGAGGGTYGDNTGKMPTPESGSGGGSGGLAEGLYSGIIYYDQIGGGGGGGGGFIDITAEGNIKILGTIDVSGGKGGSGGGSGTWSGSGGGGGGSGGGLRLLTPNDIEVASTTVITAIGGAGGAGGNSSYTPNSSLVNPGGQGGVGRLVFEDSDSVITGYAGASIIPNETTSAGFYRAVFDPSRFQGGGLTPVLVTQILDIGPVKPLFEEPVQNYGVQEDFKAGIPAVSSRGVLATSMLIEVQGFPANADGTPNLLAPSGWIQIGYFRDSGAETFPTWVAGTPGDVPLPPGSEGGGFAAANGLEFVQFRVTFYLKDGMGPFDPGPYIDDWTLHFCYNQ